MNITVKKPVDLEVDAIECILPVNYGDEDIPHDFPGRKGEVLTLVLDLHTRKVRDWPAGRSEDLHMKVCDGGTYRLIGKGQVIEEREGYVPACIPGDYGDYVNLSIDGDGTIYDEFDERWEPDSDEIAQAFFPEEDCD